MPQKNSLFSDFLLSFLCFLLSVINRSLHDCSSCTLAVYEYPEGTSCFRDNCSLPHSPEDLQPHLSPRIHFTSRTSLQAFTSCFSSASAQGIRHTLPSAAPSRTPDDQHCPRAASRLHLHVVISFMCQYFRASANPTCSSSFSLARFAVSCSGQSISKACTFVGYTSASASTPAAFRFATYCSVSA